MPMMKSQKSTQSGDSGINSTTVKEQNVRTMLRRILAVAQFLAGAENQISNVKEDKP
jgi:hypothetical protein